MRLFFTYIALRLLILFPIALLGCQQVTKTIKNGPAMPQDKKLEFDIRKREWQGIELSVALARTGVKGQPLMFWVTISNHSDKVLRYDGVADNSMYIIGPNGKETLSTPKGIDEFGSEVNGHYSKKLNPGETVQRVFNLTDYFDLIVPGKYRVVYSRNVYWPHPSDIFQINDLELVLLPSD